MRVGLKPEGRAPAREGAVITTPDGREVGIVTSGGFGPTVNGPVAMGYVSKDVSAPGTDLHLIVRGKADPGQGRRHAFRPTPLQALTFRREHDHDHALHQGPRIHPRRGRHRRRRHLRLRAGASSGTSSIVELPSVGKSLAKGDEAAVVESVKAASEIYAPVSGEVVEVNGDLEVAPGTVNEDPAGRGWFMKIRLTDPAELDALMTEEQYQEFVKSIS